MKNIVLVHGWSVTNLDTYGGLPERLAAEAVQRGMDLHLEHIFLSRYISFHDEVTLADIALAFEMALQERPELDSFVCITHSTGGPVVRLWWETYYAQRPSPISHLIMLAPANFGSALAQLGKGKLSRIKSFFAGVEPGQGVLDWLELGSASSWQLNQKWIEHGADLLATGTYPFVLTGQSIDRAFYDHLNTYTGEMGSDGVVRTACAQLTSRYLRVEQEFHASAPSPASTLTYAQYTESPQVPLRVLAGKSHSGNEKGIMASVTPSLDDANSAETIQALFDCMAVDSPAAYKAVYQQFEAATTAVQVAEREEHETSFHFFDTTYIHDVHSQLIFRVRDHEGHPVTDFDLLLTAGADSNPNYFPAGFAPDRQRNSKAPHTLTYYMNYSVLQQISELGLRLFPRPDTGFVRYFPCELKASTDFYQKVLRPNSTTLVDIVVHRAVSKEVFRVDAANAGVERDFSC